MYLLWQDCKEQIFRSLKDKKDYSLEGYNSKDSYKNLKKTRVEYKKEMNIIIIERLSHLIYW